MQCSSTVQPNSSVLCQVLTPLEARYQEVVAKEDSKAIYVVAKVRGEVAVQCSTEQYSAAPGSVRGGEHAGDPDLGGAGRHRRHRAPGAFALHCGDPRPPGRDMAVRAGDWREARERR